MHRRTAGIVLISLAVVLFCTRYIAAAIWAQHMQSWSRELYKQVLNAMGGGLVTASWLALIAGIAYLAVAEFVDVPRRNRGKDERRNSIIKQIKDNWQQDLDDR